MDFVDIHEEPISLKEIVSLVEDDFSYNVYVGTDSHVHRDKKKVLYASCIVLHKKGKGGRMFVWKQFDKIVKLRQRLTSETWRSLEIAFALKEIFPTNVDIIVHLDVNSDSKAKSSLYYQELVGMITGQGFKCHIKPDSFAATKAADRYSK